MKEVPKFMQKGSKGPHVSPLHSLLCGAGFGKGLKFDATFGNITKRNLKKLQEKLKVEADGCFGPNTRKAVKKAYGFNFDEICQTIPGTTTFVDMDKGVDFKNDLI